MVDGLLVDGEGAGALGGLGMAEIEVLLVELEVGEGDAGGLGGHAGAGLGGNF